MLKVFTVQYCLLAYFGLSSRRPVCLSHKSVADITDQRNIWLAS